MQVPWIHEDRISKEDFIAALENMMNTKTSELQEMGENGRKHVLSEYGLSDYVNNWDNLLTSVHTEKGSWATRKGYQSWNFGVIE